MSLLSLCRAWRKIFRREATMKSVYLLLGLCFVTSVMAGCSNSGEHPIANVPTFNTHQRCISLANKIKTLNIYSSNIVSPKNTELPENSKIIDIYEIIEYLNNKQPSLEIERESLICRAKARTSQGNYPIEFYLITENELEYIILESQGKRKWIFRWKA